MKRKAEQKLCFFKILTKTDFDRLLRLPQVFMRKYGSIFTKNVKLRIETGRTWDVKVEAMENGLFCFKRGWNFFAQDVGLKFGEVLFFTLNGDGFTLNVSVFETNGCKKEILDNENDDDDDDGYDLRMGSRSRETRNPLYYEIVLKTHNRYRVTLKRGFARAANLFGKKRVVVEGEVRLDFRTANGLVIGKL